MIYTYRQKKWGSNLQNPQFGSTTVSIYDPVLDSGNNWSTVIKFEIFFNYGNMHGKSIKGVFIGIWGTLVWLVNCYQLSFVLRTFHYFVVHRLYVDTKFCQSVYTFCYSVIGDIDIKIYMLRSPFCNGFIFPHYNALLYVFFMFQILFLLLLFFVFVISSLL